MKALNERLRQEVDVEIDYDALADVKIDLSDLPATQ